MSSFDKCRVVLSLEVGTLFLFLIVELSPVLLHWWMLSSFAMRDLTLMLQNLLAMQYYLTVIILARFVTHCPKTTTLMLTVKVSQIAAQRVISSCYIKILHEPDHHSYQNEYVLYVPLHRTCLT